MPEKQMAPCVTIVLPEVLFLRVGIRNSGDHEKEIYLDRKQEQKQMAPRLIKGLILFLYVKIETGW